MGFHRNVDGLKCSFEQCKVGSKKLVDIRQHIRQAHSVKNPSLGTHFSDEYSTKPAITKQLFDAKEADLASIYDCLDDLIDKDVLGDVELQTKLLLYCMLLNIILICHLIWYFILISSWTRMLIIDNIKCSK